jgi:hypothetical protein
MTYVYCPLLVKQIYMFKLSSQMVAVEQMNNITWR